MFTGIVQAVGRVRTRESRGGDLRLEFDAPAALLAGAAVGDSIAVNGVCLTAVTVAPAAFAADLSPETLARTTLGALAAGAAVNLEPSLRAGQALSGHFVSGHVDATAHIVALREDARSLLLEIELPAPLAPYVVEKGSIAVDGVSLTVNTVARDRFGVTIIPHTRAVTIIDGYCPGTRVNLEADLIARYLRGLLPPGRDAL
jgi:riboflavin synthase